MLILVANALADVKIAAQHGSSEDTLKALSNPCLQLPVDSKNVNLYYSRYFFYPYIVKLFEALSAVFILPKERKFHIKILF